MGKSTIVFVLPHYHQHPTQAHHSCPKVEFLIKISEDYPKQYTCGAHFLFQYIPKHNDIHVCNNVFTIEYLGISATMYDRYYFE